MTPENDKILQALQYEEMLPQTYWWLSFADTDKPKGKQFLGVTVVLAGGPASACQATHILGINPGGQVAFECLGKEVLYPDLLNRLETSSARLKTLVEASRKSRSN